MTDLSREARELVRRAKAAEVPAGAFDRARVRAALDARLALGAGAGAAAAAAGAGSRGHASWTVVARWVVGLGVVGLAAAGARVAFIERPTAELGAATAQIAAPMVPAATTTAAQEPSDPPTIAVTDLPSAPPSGPTRAAARVHTASPAAPPGEEQAVSEELSILLRAQTAMRAGSPEAALAALDEHARRFPAGALAEERSSERVFALCALGRTADARVEAAHFLSAFSKSPSAARVSVSCGAEPRP
jgi:hypothetical protein